MTYTEILSKVAKAIDALIHAGDRHEGLFPSLLDLNTHEMLDYVPDCIPGQRRGDRCHFGSNLIHDTPTLGVMYALSASSNSPEYAEAADRYLRRFATHCTDTVTGLFPWGEHAYWHLLEDKIGNSSRFHDPNSANPAIHDHLRQAPAWLWEKLYEFNPRCVERFAEGLDYHWRLDPPEYSRHGEIEVKQRPDDYGGACSFDFARHGGFYIQDWTFAYVKTGRQDFLRQIHKMLDYWWPVRYSDGLLPYCKRCTEHVLAFYQVHACAQTMGHAASLWDSANMLQEKYPALAATMRERAAAYVNAFIEAPHDPENGVVYIAHKPGDPERDVLTSIWGSVYGVLPAAFLASLCLHTYRIIQDPRFLRWAEAVGAFYLKEPPPADVAVPSNDAGLALGLVADLYDLTGDSGWLKGGVKLAETLMDVYLDTDIPRGAAGIDWYESQMGPGFLLHGLARIALLAQDTINCPLEADYTSR